MGRVAEVTPLIPTAPIRSTTSAHPRPPQHDSYQACESLYTQNDAMSSKQARQLMLSQVAVADEAVGQSTGGRKGTDKKKVGLCLGPFGATLQPGQE